MAKSHLYEHTALGLTSKGPTGRSSMFDAGGIIIERFIEHAILPHVLAGVFTI